MKLRLATAQFAVSSQPKRNADAIVDAIDEAAAAGARVLHFCEGALSGYAPQDLEDWRGYDWQELGAQARRVAEAAGARGIWVVLGSAHPLSLDGSGPLPHNSVYIIDDHGVLVDRYDKRFCAGAEGQGELALYSPGDHPCLFEIDGVRCGVMICHEYRYPELYRDYKRQGAQLLFHSFHAANNSDEVMAELEAQVGAEHHAYNCGRTLPEITMPATLVAAAAASHMWMSAANSCAPRSCWSSFFVRPDGVIVGRLERDKPGVLVQEPVPAGDDLRVFGILVSAAAGRLLEIRKLEDRPLAAPRAAMLPTCAYDLHSLPCSTPAPVVPRSRTPPRRAATAVRRAAPSPHPPRARRRARVPGRSTPVSWSRIRGSATRPFPTITSTRRPSAAKCSSTGGVTA